MRASRLLSLLLLLQTRGRLTAAELAQEPEVSIRTVYRDVEALGAAGVPLYADRGPTGGYQLLDGYRTRLTGLTGDEAAALALAGIPGPAAELGLGALLAAAQLQVQATLPAGLRERIAQLGERFLLDAPGWSHIGEETPHLAEVAEAVWQQRAIRVRYQRWNGSVGEATLEPLGIVLKAGIWYLVAQGRGKARTYRVSRLLELTMLDDGFARPADFNLAAFWRTFAERFRASLLSRRGDRQILPSRTGTFLPARSRGCPGDRGNRQPTRRRWLDSRDPPDRVAATRRDRPAPLRRGGRSARPARTTRSTARGDDGDGRTLPG